MLKSYSHNSTVFFSSNHYFLLIFVISFFSHAARADWFDSAKEILNEGVEAAKEELENQYGDKNRRLNGNEQTTSDANTVSSEKGVQKNYSDSSVLPFGECERLTQDKINMLIARQYPDAISDEQFLSAAKSRISTEQIIYKGHETKPKDFRPVFKKDEIINRDAAFAARQYLDRYKSKYFEEAAKIDKNATYCYEKIITHPPDNDYYSFEDQTIDLGYYAIDASTRKNAVDSGNTYPYILAGKSDNPFKGIIAYRGDGSGWKFNKYKSLIALDRVITNNSKIKKNPQEAERLLKRERKKRWFHRVYFSIDRIEPKPSGFFLPVGKLERIETVIVRNYPDGPRQLVASMPGDSFPTLDEVKDGKDCSKDTREYVGKEFYTTPEGRVERRDVYKKVKCDE